MQGTEGHTTGSAREVSNTASTSTGHVVSAGCGLAGSLGDHPCELRNVSGCLIKLTPLVCFESKISTG